MGDTVSRPCPLPERIPVRADRIYYRENEEGVEERVQSYSVFIERLRDEANVCVIEDKPLHIGKMAFFRYKLPQEGYRMVDISEREDVPYFVILDEKNQIRVSVSGTWKGAYDLDLETYICSAPYEVADLEEIRRAPMEETASTHANYQVFERSFIASTITRGRVPVIDPEDHKAAAERQEDYAGAK